jgi:hypothetical protein
MRPHLCPVVGTHSPTNNGNFPMPVLVIKLLRNGQMHESWNCQRGQVKTIYFGPYRAAAFLVL